MNKNTETISNEILAYLYKEIENREMDVIQVAMLWKAYEQDLEWEDEHSIVFENFKKMMQDAKKLLTDFEYAKLEIIVMIELTSYGYKYCIEEQSFKIDNTMNEHIQN